MANQIVVSAGAKVRNLDGVLTGTSGVVNSLPINASNGIPQLDVNGKILVSQLPNSVMEYQGVWNANTNTPTLVNGTGNQGDVYLCNVAGTVDFGAGPIAFVVGDQVIYSGSIWQRASGATGTVTSVAITESGDSLNITGSPITTSGTINIGFNGTNLQYVNGAGNLTTFPTLITSIGLSMPSAFSVANSPLTANGTIAVTGAGYASQYIRGDGTLADFPSSGGGGSSVSYYLNGGTSQGTIGGTTYYEMSKTADTGTGVDFAKSGDGFIVAFLTDANDPAQLNIPAGNWNYEIYASMSANGGTPQMYAELYKYDGTTFTLISTSSNEILYDGTNLNLYTFGMTVPATTLTLTDRLAVKLYATNSGSKTTTVHTQDSHLCQVITTFSTGITALNGLTAQVQYFQTGTSGTDFNISSTTATHTFNLPTASATNRGALSSADWSTFNGKENTLTFYSPLVKSGSSVTIPPATSIANGYLTSTDWSTFNSKQAALSGTGFVKISGTTISYDNSTYYLASNPSAFITLTSLSAGAGISYNNTTGVITNSAPDQTVSLTAGAGISVSGTYPSFTIASTITQYTDALARASLSFAAGSGAYNSTTGVITIPTNNNQITNGAGYITGNQTITLSGDVSGSGTTAITTTIGALKVTNAMLAGSIDLTTKVTGLLPDGNISSAATWNAKQNAITLTTTGTSGAATLVGATLNIPQYTDTYTGTVTSVAALTIGTTGTDLSSSVANSTTTPVITLNVPTASATNRGALSSADWTTFNNKQNALTNPVLASGTWTSGYLPKINGTYTIGNSTIREISGQVGIGITPTGSWGLQIFGNGTANTVARIQLQNTSTGSADGDGGGISMEGNDFVTRNNESGVIKWELGGTPRLELTNSGNLGLGVTPSAWNSGYKAIQNNSTSWFSTISRDANFGTNVFVNSGGNYAYIETAVASLYTQFNGVHSWYNAPSGTAAGAVITFTQAMTLTASGELFINGTTDYGDFKLQVNGNEYIKLSQGAVQTWSNSGNSTVNIRTNTGYNSILSFTEEAVSDRWSIGTKSADSNLYFSTGDALSAIKLTLSNAGAATFSSSVTANGLVLVNGSHFRTSGAYTGNQYYNASAATNEKAWMIQPSGDHKNFLIGTMDDAFSGMVQQALNITRSGTTVSNISFPNGTFNVTGAATFSSSVTATSFFESSSIKGKDIIATNPLLALDIDVIKYTRKSDESKDIRYGYSAEQIHSLMPELTDKDVTAVKYLDVHTILIANLQKEIKELKAKINN